MSLAFVSMIIRRDEQLASEKKSILNGFGGESINGFEDKWTFKRNILLALGRNVSLAFGRNSSLALDTNSSLIGLLGKCVIGLRRTDHSAVRIKKQDKDLSQYSL